MSKRKRILIVDDEPDLREILADEFRYEGFEVFEAANGIEGLQLFLKDTPDVVISDIRMPDGDGVTLAKAINSNNSVRIPVFLITGFADLTPEEAYDFGVEGFFIKPFSLDLVRKGVLRAIMGRDQKFRQTASEPPVGELIIVGEDWRESLRSSEFKIGRGGLSVSQDVFLHLPQSLRPQDAIEVKSGHQPLFTGIIRWLRNAEDEQRASLGIEFLSISAEFFDFYKAQMDQEQGPSFIPSQRPL